MGEGAWRRDRTGSATRIRLVTPRAATALDHVYVKMAYGGHVVTTTERWTVRVAPSHDTAVQRIGWLSTCADPTPAAPDEISRMLRTQWTQVVGRERVR